MTDAGGTADATSAREAPFEPKAPAVLAVDVGGSHVKVLVNGGSERRRFVSGKKFTAPQMVERVLEHASDLEYASRLRRDPGSGRGGRVVHEPVNLGKGWAGFDYAARVRQADEGRQRRRDAGARELRGRPDALPRARHRARLDDDRGRGPRADGARPPAVQEGDVRGLRRERGHASAWARSAGGRRSDDDRRAFVAALEPEYVVLGGGNAKRIGELPPNVPPRRERGRVPRRVPALGRLLSPQ